MRIAALAAIALSSVLTAACTEAADAQTGATPAATAQVGDGRPYQLSGTQVWDVPDPVSGRRYQVFVSLPPSYEASPGRTYPVLYVADADYGFPLIRSISKRVNLEGPQVEEFILVGLSYAEGDDGMTSRRRDYTPTAAGTRGARDQVHGGGAAYQTYVRDQVLPFVEDRFHADPARRVFMGHSYGSLLGAQILFTQPELFSGYILGSPSLWYDDRHMLKVEADYARTHRDLRAKVFLYIGGYETVRPGPRYNRTEDMVADVATFERNLKSRNYPGLTVTSEVLEGEDHLTVFPAGLTHGLLHMLPAPAGD